MEILKFNEFMNENKLNESGIPLYKGTVVEPTRNIKRSNLLVELQEFLTQGEVSVLAEIPTQGKNTPAYLKDIYREIGKEDKPKEEDMYDPETDVFLGNRDRADDVKQTVFIDSEFIVKGIDMTKGLILATPYSLKDKGIIVELDPEIIDEVFLD